MKKLLVLVAVAALLLLAGCAEPDQDPSEAVDGSSAVADVAIGTDDGQPYLNLSMHEVVKQNDEVCTTSYNPALGTTTTTCSDNWHEVTVEQITVKDGDGNVFDELERTEFNGETVQYNIPWESGEYYFHFDTANGGTTVFSVSVQYDDGELTLDGAGYDDSY